MTVFTGYVNNDGLRTLLILLALSLRPSEALLAADVLTAQYDNARTASNPSEVYLSTINVNPARFGKLFTRTLDGWVFAQPLYMKNVAVPGHATVNLVFVCTAHNTVYAFDADNAAVSAPYWSRNLGPSDTTPNTFASPNSEDETGIVATPVIVPALHALYVLVATREFGQRVFRLHALDISTGQEQFGGPVVVAGHVVGNAPDAVNGLVNFNPTFHLQRSALAYVNHTVYVGFAGVRDIPPFHGWLFGYDAATLNQTAVFDITPNGYGGGIWHGGRAPAADDATGSIYLETGNGNFDGTANLSNSVLKFSSAQQSLAVTGRFTPSDWQTLSDNDLDLSSAGPLLIPGTRFLVTGGKAGVLYLLDSTAMGNTTPDNIVQRFQATPACPPSSLGCHRIHSFSFWNSPATPTLYLWADGDVPRSWAWSGGGLTPNATPGTRVAGYPGASLTVSSYSGTPRTGILWGLSGDNSTGAASLRAFDALDLSKELWNSDMNAARDAMGQFGKFSVPVVANGKVYAGNFSSQLVVYGLLNGPVPGDANADGIVDCSDAAIVQAAFGKSSSQPGFDLRADLNSDGVVNVRDLMLVTQRLPTGVVCH